MNENNKQKLDDIRLRWENSMKSVCPNCMSACIRHWDRNEECYNDDKNVEHPDRYDGELYAQAGADIKCLIKMIKKLEKKKEEKKKEEKKKEKKK